MSVSPLKTSFADAPAGPVPDAGAARIAESLVLLAHDESLIEALTSVVPKESLTVVANDAALAQQLLSDPVGVVFIDAAVAQSAGATAQLIQRLHNQLPDVVLVVAGDGAAQGELSSLVTDGTIYRFVHKPVSAQRVKLFIDAAWRKRESGSASGIYPALPMPPAQGSQAPARSREFPWLAVLAATLALGASVAGYLLLRTPRAAAESPPLPTLAVLVQKLPPVAVPATAAPARPVIRRHPLAQVEVSVAPDLTPVVAASATTTSDATPARTPVQTPEAAGSGPPSSTPPVSEAHDPNSVAAVILERTYSPDPEFPEIAREQDLTGFVDLEFVVRADGTVSDVSVLKAQPRGVFDQAAVDAVSKWRYRPIERDGVAVDEHARLRLNFGYR